MVALLKPRIAGKAKLEDASDIRALKKAKSILEGKGYKGVDLMTMHIAGRSPLLDASAHAAAGQRDA